MASSAEKALAELDKALAMNPEVDGHVFSTAAHFLGLQRDAMAARQREAGASPDSRRKLEHINAVISVVLGVHFPLGTVPWAELEKARGWLAELTDHPAGGGGAGCHRS
jgi:HPt (histidine-containing phosphotransfer) domain-containing protein